MLAAFAGAIIAIAMWSAWVVRTHRGRSHVHALPVVVLALVAVFETLAVRAVLAPLGDDASAKATALAGHISRGMGYFACAWASVGVALLVLAVLSLRAPRDPDAPTARVVR